MPLRGDEKKDKYENIEAVLHKVGYLKHGFKLIDASKKTFDQKEIMPLLDTKLGCNTKSTCVPSCLKKFLEKILGNKATNTLSTLADEFLFVPDNIKELEYYNILSGASSLSCGVSLLWSVLSYFGKTPDKKSWAYNTIDTTITVLSFGTTLVNDILDIIYNPNPYRKWMAIAEIGISSAANILHLFNLFK